VGEVLGPAGQATDAQLSMIAPAASAAPAVIVDQRPCGEDLLVIGWTALSLTRRGPVEFENPGLRLFNESRRSSSTAFNALPTISDCQIINKRPAIPDGTAGVVTLSKYGSDPETRVPQYDLSKFWRL
jgi:hypothetical protein